MFLVLENVFEFKVMMVDVVVFLVGGDIFEFIEVMEVDVIMFLSSEIDVVVFLVVVDVFELKKIVEVDVVMLLVVGNVFE